VLLLVAVLLAALLGCGSAPDAAPTGTPPAASGRGRMGPAPSGSAGRSSQGDLAQLGISGTPNRTEPQGLKVTGFTGPSGSSPLDVLGVEQGDVIVSCNGMSGQLGARIISAIEGLNARGEPITLVVARDGKRITLERTEELPASGGSSDSK
jgi:S1-C subfamily serine protease